MIARYDCPEISEIWNDTNKFRQYLEVEIALLTALEGKKIPEGITEIIKEKSQINPTRIKEIELETRHDVIAFCTSITENLPRNIGKYFHFGCTSSDIIDTATTLQMSLRVAITLEKSKQIGYLTNYKKILLPMGIGLSQGISFLVDIIHMSLLKVIILKSSINLKNA
jgi:adenylosuccinate lyase